MWKQQDNKLFRSFEFKNFSEAFAFMTRVAFLAEQHNHHPDGRTFITRWTYPFQPTMRAMLLQTKTACWQLK